MTRPLFARFLSIGSIGLLASVFLAGCGSDPSTAASFSASTTAPTPGLVKLEQKSRSGARVVLDVRIHGPEPNLDLLGFHFGIRVGDASLVKLAAQASYPQDVLVAGAGQTIATVVDPSDPTLIRISVEKQGGGAGNGFAGDTALVIELPFDVQAAGVTTLTLSGIGNVPPQAFDSTRSVIAGVTFDTASATVRGVTTGGSGY